MFFSQNFKIASNFLFAVLREENYDINHKLYLSQLIKRKHPRLYFWRRLKTLLTISLALLFLAQSFTRSFVYLNYQMNKNYISTVLCENKTKKEMHCEGKCHLKKELEKEEKKESAPTGNSKEKIEFNFFNEIKSFFSISERITKNYFVSNSMLLPQNCDISVFHPPKV